MKTNNKTTVRMVTDVKNQLKLVAVTLGVDLEDVVNIIAMDFIKDVTKDKSKIDTLKTRLLKQA